jgi:HK97 family phage prohead protease
MEKELRSFPSDLKVEKRADGRKKISGFAAVFDKLSEDLGNFRERIAPGAFREALKNSDTRALYNHNADMVLGRESANTLRLEERAKGLWMEIIPPDTSFARDLIKSIERKDIKEQSFSFQVAEDSWEHLDTPDREAIRTITKIANLFDVGPVTYPAYPQTSAALRSMEAARDKSTDDGLLDDLLKDDFSEVDDLLADL